MVDIWEKIEQAGVIAVLVVDEVNDAAPLARALLDGGIEAMELTLRTPAAVDALRAIRAEVPDMLAGIGTILTPAQVAEVLHAGAAFGVSPGMNPRVIQAALDNGLPFAPGIATPSELERAIEMGCRNVKFFPAEPQGGLPYLRSMMAPYRHLGIRCVPLGGLNMDNMKAYLADEHITAIGGSWLAPRDRIRQGDWQAIRDKAQAARQAIDEVRKNQA